MSEHRARIDWKRETDDFSYRSYNRGHTWSFESGIEVRASAAPQFLGSTDRVDPEEAFVAALSSCHMLTFLALASREGFVVDGYRDDPVGFLEKKEDGKPAMVRVALRPRAAFGGGRAPSAEELDALHHRAHEACFLARSVLTEISVEPCDFRSERA